MKNKIMSILLALAIIITVVPLGASAFAATASVSLNKSGVTLGVGETYTLTASGSSSYTWSSGSTSVASVSGGKITAKKSGTATVTVKDKNGKTATCKVTVKPAPTKITLNKTSITLGVGETFDLNSSVNSGAASYRRTYTTSNSAVATVPGSIITAKKVGTATMTVKTYNGKTATCKVTVKPAPTKVTLNKTSITLGVGETFDLNSSVNSGAASYRRTYTTSNSAVATVPGSIITAKKVGTATMTVKTYNGKTATCKVTVKSAPTSISLNKTSLSLTVGETFDLDSSVNSGAASYKRIYTTSNSAVATVPGSIVTAKKAGTAIITVTAYNGRTATCRVTVKNPQTSTGKTVYSNMTFLTLYEKPQTGSASVQIPYHAQMTYVKNYSTSSAGKWDEMKYENKTYYMWSDTGEVKTTEQAPNYNYSAANIYERGVIDRALAFKDVKTSYVHGADGELVNGVYRFDCVGFAATVLESAMKPYVPLYDIPNSVVDLYNLTGTIYNTGTSKAFNLKTVIAEGEKIDMSKLRPGDILFFRITDDGYTLSKSVDHVGVYLGNGEFIHCTSSWNRVIVMPFKDIYVDGFVKAVRYIPETVQTVDSVKYTTSTKTAFRSSMNSDSESNVIKRLDSEVAVTVKFTSRTGVWAYVSVNGTNGYVQTEYLTSTPPAASGTIGYLSATSLRLYKNSTANSDYIEIFCTTPVTLMGKKSGTNYYRVSYNGGDYYVYTASKPITEFFATDLNKLLAGSSTAKVNANTYLRSSMSTANDSNKIVMLSSGGQIMVIAVSDSGTWAYVKSGNTYGYVLAKYLTIN